MLECLDPSYGVPALYAFQGKLMRLGMPHSGPMPTKERVNSPCACGSGKKYKRCCMNVVRLQEHPYVPPQTATQSAVRTAAAELGKGILEPHCVICGDTNRDSKILRVPTQKGESDLCEDCYRIQIAM